MKTITAIAGAIGITLLLVACGGGGGGSGEAGGSTTNALRASTYSGDFLSPCFAISNATNYETGTPLYATSLLSVGSSNGAVAPVDFRFDFYDNASCAGEALGVLRNRNPDSVLTLVSAVNANGRTAHKLRMDFGMAVNATYLSGPTSDTVIYGTAIRLKLPRIYFQAFSVTDLWALDNNNLYEGSYESGADGFPLRLSTTPDAVKLASAPPLPAAPCAAQAVTWNSGSNICLSSLTPSASLAVQQAVNTSISSKGAASFTCSNGTWSAPANASCTSVYVPPVIVGCPAQTYAWTANGLSCSGQVPARTAPDFVPVQNTLPSTTGYALRSCQPDGTWTDLYSTFTGSCDVAPPPPAPITDPLLLAQAKNCLLCHAVSGSPYSLPNGSNAMPTFQQIANFYRASPPAAGVLENRVKSGSSGVFGALPMPASSQVSDADLAILIPWILAQPQ